MPKMQKTAYDDALGQRMRAHFQTEAADAGLRSLFGAFVDMALAGPPGDGGSARAPDAAFTDRRRLATAEHRRIRAALAAIPAPHARALVYAYAPESWGEVIVQRFPALGQCCGVVLLSCQARRSFGKACTGAVPSIAVKLRERGIGEWLRVRAPREVVDAATAEGEALLRAARAAIGEHLRQARAVRAGVRGPRLDRVEPLDLGALLGWP